MLRMNKKSPGFAARELMNKISPDRHRDDDRIFEMNGVVCKAAVEPADAMFTSFSNIVELSSHYAGPEKQCMWKEERQGGPLAVCRDETRVEDLRSLTPDQYLRLMNLANWLMHDGT